MLLAIPDDTLGQSQVQRQKQAGKTLSTFPRGISVFLRSPQCSLPPFMSHWLGQSHRPVHDPISSRRTRSATQWSERYQGVSHHALHKPTMAGLCYGCQPRTTKSISWGLQQR